MPGVVSSQSRSFPWETVCATALVMVAVVGFVLAHKHTPFMPFLSDDYLCVGMTHPPSAYHVLRSLISEKCDIIFYRPLLFASFTADGLLWGTNPLGFHLTNLVLHATNAFLIYLLAFRLIRHRGGALASAAFFLVFPLQHEVVIWVSGRADSLSTLFYLLCALSYFEYRTSGRRRYFHGAILSGFLSLLSKESGVTFPVLLLGMELTLFQGGPASGRKGRLLRLSGLLLIIPLYIGFRWLALRDVIPLFLDSLSARPTDVSTVRLLLQSLVGIVASVFYHPWRPIATPFNLLVEPYSWHVWLSRLYHVFCLLLVLVGFVTGAFRNRVAVFCTALFFASLLPSGVMLPWIQRDSLQNARVLYLSLAFLSIFAGNLAFGGRDTGFRVLRSRVRFALVTLLVALLSMGLFRNRGPWLEASRLSGKILERFEERALDMDHPGVIYVEGVPISHGGVYVLGPGFVETVNLAMGTLPDFRLAPGERKISAYVDHLLRKCPWKPMVPSFLAHDVLPAQLACQGYSYPAWYSKDPADYEHVIRWNQETESFEVVR